MAMEEKNTAARARVRFLDVVLVVLIVLCVLAVWQKNNLAYIFESGYTQGSYSVSFEIRNIRYDTTETLNANTVFYATTARGQAELGTLVDEPTVLPRIGTVRGADGEEASVLLPQTDPKRYVDLNGTFTCRGVMRDGNLVVGDITLAVGTSVAVKTEDSTLSLRVVSITENV